MKHLLALLLLASCGKAGVNFVKHVDEIPTSDNLIVLARASFTVSTTTENELSKAMSFFINSAYAANPTATPVTVVLAGTTSMTVSTAAFSVPVSMTNDILSFGELSLTALSTNDLKKCGVNGNTKCTKAVFRIYSSGKPGAGFWNSDDSYGVPLLASGLDTSGEAGLGTANSIILQTYNIPTNKNTVKLSDFATAPTFGISGDFTNAGAGTYATTINVEFALAP